MPTMTEEKVTERPLPKTVDPGRLLTVKDLADWWRVSRVTIWRMTRRKGDKKLPCYMAGGRPRFIYEECYWYLKNGLR